MPFAQLIGAGASGPFVQFATRPNCDDAPKLRRGLLELKPGMTPGRTTSGPAVPSARLTVVLRALDRLGPRVRRSRHYRARAAPNARATVNKEGLTHVTVIEGDQRRRRICPDACCDAMFLPSITTSRRDGVQSSSFVTLAACASFVSETSKKSAGRVTENGCAGRSARWRSTSRIAAEVRSLRVCPNMPNRGGHRGVPPGISRRRTQGRGPHSRDIKTVERWPARGADLFLARSILSFENRSRGYRTPLDILGERRILHLECLLNEPRGASSSCRARSTC